MYPDSGGALSQWEKNMHRCQFTMILLILALAAGCASIRGNNQAASPMFSADRISLAVLPFHNAPDVRDSGRIVADILANQLYALGNYQIVAPEAIEKRLADQEGEALSPQKAGELAGAPYIVSGSVTEYTYKAGVGETPVIGLTARLIQSSSGTVLWSATRTGVGGGNWFQEDSLSNLAVMICKNIATDLNAFLQKYLAAGAAKELPEATQFGSNSGLR